MSDQVALGPDRPRPGWRRRQRARTETSDSEALAALTRSARRSLDWLPDARVTLVGLALVTPLALAMIIGSSVLVLLASGLVLAASLVSPITGLIALAFMAPFPSPQEVPSPGLNIPMLGAIFLGLVLRLPIDRPRLRWPSMQVSLAGGFLLLVTASFVSGWLFGPASARDTYIVFLYSQVVTTMMTFVVAFLVLRGRSPYPVLAALLLSALLASATALAQYVGAESLFGALMGGGELQGRTVVDRATGPFLDPNYFGAYLAAAASLGVACAVIAKSRVLKVAALALSTAVGVALVLTLSRGALVALVVGLATIAFTRGRRTGFLFLGAMMLVAVVAWPFFIDVRQVGDSELGAAALASQFESSRADVWLNGVERFLSSPVLGVGWGMVASSGSTAHNWYITLLSDTGLSGLTLWALFIASAVLALRTRPAAARTVGYAVLSVSMAASMFIEVPRIYASAGLVFIALAAAIAADWALRDREAQPYIYDPSVDLARPAIARWSASPAGRGRSAR